MSFDNFSQIKARKKSIWLRSMLAGSCLAAAVAVAIPQQAWAITDLPCQNGLCEPNQNNTNIESVLSLNWNGLLKPIFSLADYVLKIYMSYQSGGVDKGIALQTAGLKGLELVANTAIKDRRLADQERNLTTAALDSARDSLRHSPAEKTSILKQCHAMGAAKTTNSMTSAINSAYITADNDVSAAIDAYASGSANPNQKIASATSTTAKIRKDYGVTGSKTIELRDPVSGVCKAKKGEVLAAQVSGLTPWRTDFCKKADADNMYDMAKKQIEAGTVNNCGSNPNFNLLTDNTTPRGMTSNLCSLQAVAKKVPPTGAYANYAGGAITTLQQLADYKPMPEIYAQAVMIMKNPDNTALFGLTGLTGTNLDTAIQNYLRTNYHAAKFEDVSDASKQWVMNLDSLRQLSVFVTVHNMGNPKPNDVTAAGAVTP